MGRCSGHGRLHDATALCGGHELEIRQDNAHHQFKALTILTKHGLFWHDNALGYHGTGAIATQSQSIKGGNHAQLWRIGWHKPERTHSSGLQWATGPDVAVGLACRGNPALLRIQPHLVAVRSCETGWGPE